MSRALRGASSALAAILLLAAPARASGRHPQTAGPRPAPSLVVIIVVDMLPAGTLERFGTLQSGGYRRLLTEGRRYTSCHHDHAITETGPGHASLLTGLFPRHHGIIANSWYDRGRQGEVYCVAPPGAGSSAALLRGDGLGDLIKSADPRSRVFSVSRKDRSALLTAGRRPDGVFWLGSEGFIGAAGPVPLPVYGADLWEGTLPGGSLFPLVPAVWSHPHRPEAGPDDDVHERSEYSRVSPHPLAAGGDGKDVPFPRLVRRIASSPWIDWLTLQLAGRILKEERLGADRSPDLLVVALSGADAIGHLYGPDSQEYLDHTLRVDGWLEPFLRQAEKAARATGGALFALSSDHGVLALPEKIAGGRRLRPGDLMQRIESAAASRLGAGPHDGDVIGAEASGHLYLRRETLERLGIPLERAIEETRQALSGLDGVARVHGAPELATAPQGDDPFLDLFRNSWDAERGGDLIVQGCERCIVSSDATGTTHGSPYDYDRRVPMILMGAGVTPGDEPGACRTVDLAPTIARWLGLSFAIPRDGRPLPGAWRVDSTRPRK